MELQDIITVLVAIFGSGGATYVTLKVKSAVNENEIKHLKKDIEEIKGYKGKFYDCVSGLEKSVTKLANGVEHLAEETKGQGEKLDKVTDDIHEVKTDIALLKQGQNKKK